MKNMCTDFLMKNHICPNVEVIVFFSGLDCFPWLVFILVNAFTSFFTAFFFSFFFKVKNAMGLHSVLYLGFVLLVSFVTASFTGLL